MGASKNESAPVETRTSEPCFTFSELFAGIGGFRVALDKLGGKCVFASELCIEAQGVYAANFGERPHGDITEVEAENITPHDILTAGFPCQPFSSLGERQGFDDPRGLLFLEIVRVLSACRPKAFILENVHNLLYVEGGRSFKAVLCELSRVGYRVVWRLINCRTLLPQQRVRVYIVGFRDDMAALDSFIWPELPILDRSLCEILDGLEVDEDESYILSDHQYAKAMSVDNWQKRLARLDGHAQTLTSNYRGGCRSEYVLRLELLARVTSPCGSVRDCRAFQKGLFWRAATCSRIGSALIISWEMPFVRSLSPLSLDLFLQLWASPLLVPGRSCRAQGIVSVQPRHWRFFSSLYRVLPLALLASSPRVMIS